MGCRFYRSGHRRSGREWPLQNSAGGNHPCPRGHICPEGANCRDCRRATEEALSALAEHFPDIERSELEARLKTLQARTPTRSQVTLPADLLEAWQLLRTDTEENFYEAGNAGLRVRHLETNNGSPSETCNKGFPKKAEAVRHNEQTPEHLSPELILEACPTLSEYPEPIEYSPIWWRPDATCGPR